MEQVNINGASWQDHLTTEKNKTYFKEIITKINQQRASGKIIFPKSENIFNALKYTELNQVKVVIIGQDPYHGLGQAHGLSFSVPEGIKPPPSLINIFKELVDDVGISMPPHGNLTSWAEQGVLLLNAVLTVEAHQAGSHRNLGWERFTDQVIRIVNEQCQNVVFLLWGSYARKKAELIDHNRHCILEAPHPSPLSAHRGFFGCKHFSKANDYLKTKGKTAINWQLT